jgi:hypothetical protein
VSNPIQSSNQGKNLSGVIGFFEDPHQLVEATKKVKEAKYLEFDAFTPYPVHGLDAAQGLERSILPFITFGAGMTGCVLGFLLEYWTSVVDWPINVGGKPFNSWPAFVPVMFECTILFAGLATAGGMFLLNRLPNVTRKSFDPRLTNQRFALWISAAAPAIAEYDPDGTSSAKAKNFKVFEVNEAIEFLKNVGAQEVKSVYAEGWF